MKRRQIIQYAGVASAGFAAPSLIYAQGASTVRILVGFPPGGTADTLSRRIAEKLRGQLAPNVVVDNRVGAGGQIALTTLRDGASDGSSMLLSPSAVLSIYPFTYPKLPYKTTDVVPVSTVAYFDLAFSVGPGVPESVKTMKDFIAWTKVNPGNASYGSPAAGSTPHLFAAYLAKINNLDWRHIPYRGSGPGFQDLLGGQLPAMSTTVGDTLPHANAGKVRVLAVSGKARSPFMPNVPTFREQGLPLNSNDWFGMYLPANASPQVQIRTAAYLQTALSQPDLVASSATAGMLVKPSTPSAASTLLKAEAEEWKRLIKIMGFTAES